MAEDDRDATIVRSTIELAHDLGLIVVAEGVESPEVMELLDEFRCDLAQGFHLCRPEPADEITDWLRRRRPGTKHLRLVG
jgi:EAL domain-containing protein (putative c-di-GMP-specific phosphodiesterase class I)